MALSVVTSRVRNLRDLLETMKHSEYFDAAWYRRQSLGARLSPSATLHYLLLGWRRGLNPSERFDTRFYISRYRDVAESKANPLKHFLIHGHQEGRLATRSGRIFREHLSPEFAPLPLFGAPAGATGRLNLVIDDHTPQLLGVGYGPLLGLAVHSAHHAGWSLRIIIRSRTVRTEQISEAISLSSGADRPSIDITRREPGPTDDVETVPDDRWWASSASAYESLRPFVSSSMLWWVMSADEATRATSGDYRECVRSLLASSTTQIIALGSELAALAPKARSPHIVSTIALQHNSSSPPARKPKSSRTLGVVVVPGHPESLPTTTVAFLEHALTHHLIDPKNWGIRLLGVDWEPLTLSGSVVVQQCQPSTAAAWLDEVSALDALVLIGSRTEQPWLAQWAAGNGVPVLTDADPKGWVKLLSAPRSAPTPSADWARVVRPIVAAMEGASG
jgi:hypothetical protein